MFKKIGVLSIVFITITVFSFFLYKSIVKTQHEQLIFCNTLLPGMSENEVLTSLKRYGDIEYSVSSSGSGYFVIYVRFTNSGLVGPKNYNLSFAKEKYVGVSTTTFLEETKPVCK
jgi:hypothetical protein